MTHHESLGNEHVLRCFLEQYRFLRRDGDGLLAQHVLSGFCSSHGQRHMEMVRQRIVDCLDLRVRQHLLVGAIGFGNAELLRPFLRDLQLPRRDRHDFQILALQHAWQNLRHADIGGGDDAPLHWFYGFHRLPPLLWILSYSFSRADERWFGSGSCFQDEHTAVLAGPCST